MPQNLQVAITLFYVVWLIAVLLLLVYLAVTSNRRLDRLEGAILDNSRRAHEAISTTVETNQALVRRTLELAASRVAPPPEPPLETVATSELAAHDHAPADDDTQYRTDSEPPQ
jgi:hypothetical protein